MADNKYCTDYAKRVAGCKKCKAKIEKGEVRIAKITASPFSDDGEMKLYHHPKCIFETFKRARATTKIIEEPGDIEGFQDLKDEDKEMIKGLIKETSKDSNGSSSSKKKSAQSKNPSTPKKKSPPKKTETPKKLPENQGVEENNDDAKVESREVQGNPDHKDNSFREFRRLCAKIADEPSYNSKTEIVQKFFTKGSDGIEFKGDLYVWVRLLLPGVVKRVYNVQSKQLVKIFARIFGSDEEEMLEDLEAGDVAETIAKFFEEEDSRIKPAKKAKLTLHDVDRFLERMTKFTREEDQRNALESFAKLNTANDLKMVVRLIKHDLRIQAGAKHVLDGLHKDAYDAFNSSRNIMMVLDKIIELKKTGNPRGKLEVGASLMHPVQPMLAQACSSVDMAFKKCPNGMYAEIKYDGERVQLHKKGKEFKYFSRSLKPVLPHKVKHFAEFIPKAFPDGSDLILDGEVLMIDNSTGNPLPFGTLGVHKAGGFKDATPCLFVFDCIYYNGKSLMDTPIKQRRKFLHDHMQEVGNHVKFSEMQHITKKEQLGNMIRRVLKEGLEGLVIKDVNSLYEPGKRHWLKVKKDYLNEGAMADSADLLVLGAYYGTGNKGGLMSIFLMGCYDDVNKKFCTVTKVHTGIDDATLERLQKELSPLMTKIKKDFDSLPKWISCNRQMTPDFVAKDPKNVPVWEISGAEFTKAELHTAGGISIRFPRITRMRDDKTWESATNLKELKHLFKVSKEETDFNIDYSSSSQEDLSAATSKQSEDDNGIIKEEDLSPVEDMDTSLETECKTEFKGRSFNKTRIETKGGLVLSVVQGDLFSCPDSTSLAHCISKDCKLGKGIAKLFRNKFGRIDEIRNSKPEIGKVSVLKERKGRFIYNLVTKPLYSDKPTYESLEQSLISMRQHLAKNKVTDLAMPKIGCGLDGLNWNAVRTLIKNVFLNENVNITVYSLDYDDTGIVEKKTLTPTKVSTSPKKNSQKTIREALSDIGKKRKSENGTDEDSSTPIKKERKSESDTEEGFGMPDVFNDCRIVICDDVQDRSKLERYVIAFGGEILADYQVDEASHIIYGQKTKPKMKSRFANSLHLTQDFLVDSIKLKKLQRASDYKF